MDKIKKERADVALVTRGLAESREKGLTVILVTHDVSEAVYLADRVILLEEGHITMDYPIELARPRERDASFAAFEQHIYRRILKYPDAPRIEYSI